jgi:hypothetical protein
MQTASAYSKNRILAHLSDADMVLLKPILSPSPYRSTGSGSPNKPIKHSYFINYGLASIVATNSHKKLEVGLIGCEGFTGLPIVLGNDRSPDETVMHVAGDGFRISADSLREAMSQSPSL